MIELNNLFGKYFLYTYYMGTTYISNQLSYYVSPSIICFATQFFFKPDFPIISIHCQMAKLFVIVIFVFHDNVLFV